MAGIATPMQQAMLSGKVGVSPANNAVNNAISKSAIGRALGVGGFGLGQSYGPVGIAGPVGVSPGGFTGNAPMNTAAVSQTIGYDLGSATDASAGSSGTSSGPTGYDASSLGKEANESSVGPGGAGGPGGDKIICAELHRQGLMNDDTYYADEAYGDLLSYSDPEVIEGYHAWANCVVDLMQRSKAATYITKIIATPWINEMSYQMGARKNGSILGKFMMKVGYPICKHIARRKKRVFASV